MPAKHKVRLHIKKSHAGVDDCLVQTWCFFDPFGRGLVVHLRRDQVHKLFGTIDI